MAEHEEFKSPGSETKEGNGPQQYDETGTLKERLGDRTQEVREKLRQSFEQTREQSKRAVETVGHRVEEKPLMTLLVALGIGFLFGMMLSGLRSGGPAQINKQLEGVQGGGIPPTM
ncbi:MAG TPA: hypothetical protein VHT73_12805 [Thermodesulfobacteriota bacterium]|nr:hypothetical protein [Thermodesulfobacteriota bacterium]